MSTICLNMIVKDEANIIVDTLNNICANVKIDYAVICDTGSTDNTVELVLNYLEKNNIQGEVHRHVWKDFGHNRNLALALCEGKTDYILVFDADDRFVGNPQLPTVLNADIYSFNFKSEDRDFYYDRKILFKNNQCVKWIGVLHESIINIQDGLVECELNGDFYIQTGHFSARNQNSDKYLNDAFVLENAFFKEENGLLKTRYAFYCATSYYSCDHIEKAIFWFEKRIEMQSSNTMETYLACRHLGMLYKQNNNFERAIFIWLKGCSLAPQYLECWYELSLLHQALGNAQVAYDFAILAFQKQNKNGAVAFEKNIATYGIDYQILTLGLLLNEHEQSYQAWQRLKQKPFCSNELNKILENTASKFNKYS